MCLIPSKTKNKKNSLMLVIFFFTVLLSGCANLNAVRSFTQVSSEAIMYKQCTEDYMSSVIDQELYTTSIPGVSQNEIVSSNERIAKARNAKDALNKVQQKLSNYTTALGQLAASDTVTSGNEKIVKGTEILVKSEWFDTNTVKAYGSLASIIEYFYVEKYRQDQLKVALEQGHDDFNVLIDALIYQVDNRIYDTLERYRKGTISYYTLLRANENSVATIAILNETEQNKLAKIENQKARLAKYSDLLKKIKESHEFMYNTRSVLSNDQIIDTLKSHEADFRLLYAYLKELN